MHQALQRYAEPTRDVFAYFWLGVVVTIAVLAGVAQQLDELDDIDDVTVQAADRYRDIAEAKAIVRTYAYEAFPAWVMDHSDRACRAGVQELEGYVSNGSRYDPWGTAYKVACDERGVLAAWSFGPDGVFRTADDVSSR